MHGNSPRQIQGHQRLSALAHGGSEDEYPNKVPHPQTAPVLRRSAAPLPQCVAAAPHGQTCPPVPLPALHTSRTSCVEAVPGLCTCNCMAPDSRPAATKYLSYGTRRANGSRQREGVTPVGPRGPRMKRGQNRAKGASGTTRGAIIRADARAHVQFVLGVAVAPA